VDYEAVARRSTGRAWRRLTPAERAGIVAGLRALLEERFLPRLAGGEPPTLTARLVRLRGDDARVRVLAAAGARSVPLELDLVRDGRGGWRVRDAVVSGLAVLEGYREQFPQLLELGGVARLLEQVETERREPAAQHAAAPRAPVGG
jgi:phospholipid transport system substrate-binding protein